MPNINFKIHHIKIEQFAEIENPKKDDIGFSISVKPGCNFNLKAVVISVIAQFTEEKRPFLLIETNSFFELSNESWKGLTEDSTGQVIIPEAFIISLVNIAISQTRGILYAKTEGSPFAKYLIPIINVGQFEHIGDLIAKPNGIIKKK